MSTLHRQRKNVEWPIRGGVFGAAVLLGVASATPAWGDCPENLTLAEMVECFGAPGAGDEGKGRAPDPRQAGGREGGPPAPRTEDDANTDVDC